MKVTVKYFASIKQAIGRNEDSLELADASTTVQDVWQQVSTGQGLDDSIMTAVNMEYVDKDTQLKDGDEVAFFPPVTGG